LVANDFERTTLTREPANQALNQAERQKPKPGPDISERARRESPYCAGIATARLVRIDSFAASMISLTPALIAGETGPSMGLSFRIQDKK
jgi:hypothetical protein